jgi:hypothetical protein
MIGRPVPSGSVVTPDKEGRFRIEGIVPGVAFDLQVVTVPEKAEEPIYILHAARDLSCKSGEAKDVGDIKTRSSGK